MKNWFDIYCKSDLVVTQTRDYTEATQRESVILQGKYKRGHSVWGHIAQGHLVGHKSDVALPQVVPSRFKRWQKL